MNFFEKGKSYVYEDKVSLQIDIGDNQYRYKYNSSCVEMSSSITSTQNLEVAVMTKISSPTSLLISASSTLDKKEQQSDSFLTSNSVDESDSRGSRICLTNDTELINLNVTG